MKRRTFLQGTVGAGAVIAAGSGLLSSAAVADSHGGAMEAAFKADNLEAALDVIGAKDAADSADIKIKAPEIAENGAVVPVTVSSTIEGVTEIAILVPNNPAPMAAAFTLGENSVATASTRLKMGKTSDVVAIVKTADAVHMAKQEVKVTIGGCGG